MREEQTLAEIEDFIEGFNQRLDQLNDDQYWD